VSPIHVGRTADASPPSPLRDRRHRSIGGQERREGRLNPETIGVTDRDAPRDPSEPHLTGRLYDPWMKRQSKHGVRGVAD
jgi:hypothetical protein